MQRRVTAQSVSSRQNNLAGGDGAAGSEHTEPGVSVCVANTVDAAMCEGTVGVQQLAN